MSNLKTVGTLTTMQLHELLLSLPSSANKRINEGIVTVYAPKGQKVISAASSDGRYWHVMAVPGLIEAA